MNRWTIHLQECNVNTELYDHLTNVIVFYQLQSNFEESSKHYRNALNKIFLL